MVENRGKDKVFNIVVMVLMGIYALMTLFPLLHVLASSFSAAEAVYRGKVFIWPVDFSLEGYRYALAETDIGRGYINTLKYTAIGCVIQLSLQFLAAYPLSRKDLKGRGIITLFFVITMFVNGGMIPTYMVVKSLGLLNKMWAIILPGCVGVFNIIIIRTYINTSIPWELQEAAIIEGCSNMQIFLWIIIPLSKPILAVMLLYAIVGYWNSYFNALLYVTKDELFPLQMVIQRILISGQLSGGNDNGGGYVGGGEQVFMSALLRYVTIVVSTLPILFLYPFFQRFFEKGMLIGSLKG